MSSEVRHHRSATVALTVWGHRLSPLFDTAAHLLIAADDDDEPQDRRRLPIGELTLRQKCLLMERNRVRRVICGAISRHCMERVLARGIGVIPLICGEVERVLAAYRGGRLCDEGFFLPGRRLAGLEIPPADSRAAADGLRAADLPRHC